MNKLLSSTRELSEYAGFRLLSPVAVKVLLALRSLLADGPGVTTYDDIAASSWVRGRATIRRALVELADHRLIRVLAARNEFGRVGLFVTLLAVPRAVPREALEKQRRLADFQAGEAAKRRRELDAFPVLEEELLDAAAGRV